jgi:hypothetical protein
MVFREIINTLEIKPIPHQEYFVSEYIKQGIMHTRTVINGRDVLNKGRFVLAPKELHTCPDGQRAKVLYLP